MREGNGNAWTEAHVVVIRGRGQAGGARATRGGARERGVGAPVGARGAGGGSPRPQGGQQRADSELAVSLVPRTPCGGAPMCAPRTLLPELLSWDVLGSCFLPHAMHGSTRGRCCEESGGEGRLSAWSAVSSWRAARAPGQLAGPQHGAAGQALWRCGEAQEGRAPTRQCGRGRSPEDEHGRCGHGSWWCSCMVLLLMLPAGEALWCGGSECGKWGH